MKFIKRILLAVLILIITALAGFLAIQLYIDITAAPYRVNGENAPICDAVMVLGASVYSDGTPSPVLAERLECAYNLYISKKAPKIIVSGDHQNADYDEVSAMKNALIKMGVNADDIWRDDMGVDTYDSMYRAKNIFNIESLIISTQNFHIDRAVYIARRLGIKAYGFPCEADGESKDVYLMFRESLAKVKAFTETDILRRYPKYGGIKEK